MCLLVKSVTVVRYLKHSLAWFCVQAYYWYELGHKRGHFASVWQRSLYNVDGLKAQPWWTAKETGYTDLVKVLMVSHVNIREASAAALIHLCVSRCWRETGR